MDDTPERALAALEKYGGWYGVLRALEDAERYRWLRDRMAVEDMPEEHPSWSTPSEEESRKVDAAVDAAMLDQGANA